MPARAVPVAPVVRQTMPTMYMTTSRTPPKAQAHGRLERVLRTAKPGSHFYSIDHQKVAQAPRSFRAAFVCSRRVGIALAAQVCGHTMAWLCISRHLRATALESWEGHAMRASLAASVPFTSPVSRQVHTNCSRQCQESSGVVPAAAYKAWAPSALTDERNRQSGTGRVAVMRMQVLSARVVPEAEARPADDASTTEVDIVSNGRVGQLLQDNAFLDSLVCAHVAEERHRRTPHLLCIPALPAGTNASPHVRLQNGGIPAGGE